MLYSNHWGWGRHWLLVLQVVEIPVWAEAEFYSTGWAIWGVGVLGYTTVYRGLSN